MDARFEGPVGGHEAVALGRAERDPAGRNVALVFDLQGQVDVDALGRAVRWVGERHEGLRTSFVRRGDAWIRRVHAPCLDLQVVDGDRDAVHARIRTLASLDTAPLVTVTLVRAPGADRLVLVADHVVMDLYAARIALRELASAYSAVLRGELPALRPPPQPRELLAGMDARIGPARADRSWAVPWPADGFALCRDAGLDGPVSSETAIVATMLPGATTATGAVVAFTRALRKRFGRDDVGFSLARGGRQSHAERHAVASLVYTDTFAPGATADADLMRVADAFVRDLAPWRRLYNPVMQPPTRRILLNVLGPATTLHLSTVTGTPRPDLMPPPELSEFHDLVLQLVQLGSVHLAAIAYRTSWIRPETASALLDGFVRELK